MFSSRPPPLTYHFLSSTRDNFGFITYRYTCDAFAALENGHTLRRSNEPQFELCFGGQKQFCKSHYTDLGKCSFVVLSHQPPAVIQYICVAGRTVSEKRGKKGKIRQQKKSDVSRSKETHLVLGTFPTVLIASIRHLWL